MTKDERYPGIRIDRGGPWKGGPWWYLLGDRVLNRIGKAIERFAERLLP